MVKEMLVKAQVYIMFVGTKW